MNKKFHRIMVDGETYYRELDCGEVVGPLMEEDEFFDLIMSEVVEEEYETGAVEAEMAIDRMYDIDDQRLVSNYIAYLKMAAGM